MSRTSEEGAEARRRAQAIHGLTVETDSAVRLLTGPVVGEVTADTALVFHSGMVPRPANPEAERFSREFWGDTETQTLSVFARLEESLKGSVKNLSALRSAKPLEASSRVLSAWEMSVLMASIRASEKNEVC